MLYERSTVGPSQHDRLDLEIAEHTVVKLVHVCCSIERGLGVASRTLLPGPRIRGDPFPNGVAIRRRPTGTAPISASSDLMLKLGGAQGASRRLLALPLCASSMHRPPTNRPAPISASPNQSETLPRPLLLTASHFVSPRCCFLRSSSAL